MAQQQMKIGELARSTGLTAKTIRFYELLRLLEEPARTESGYRLYEQKHVERLEFIKKAKRLGLSLEEVRDILALHEQKQAPCVHVLALMDQKLEQVDAVLKGLRTFQRELTRLREESKARLDRLPGGARICGIIERGIHTKGEVALAWLEGQDKAKSTRSMPR